MNGSTVKKLKKEVTQRMTREKQGMFYDIIRQVDACPFKIRWHIGWKVIFGKW